MRAIFLWELRRRRNFIIWWSVGVLALVLVLMSIYPSIHQQAAQLDQIMKQLPESVRALRGGSSDLSSPVGYLNAELFYITLPLLFIIMAVNLGSGLLAKDEQEHTLELILARPVSRGVILLAKALSGLCIIAVVGLVGTLTAVVSAKLVGMDLASRYIVLASLGATVFAASFGALAYALSAASILSRKLGITIAVIASFGGYLLESLSSMSDVVKSFAQLLPYHYFMPQDLLAGKVSRGLILYMLGIFVVCGLVSFVGFRRRDIG